jgi:hypothetical protein
MGTKLFFLSFSKPPYWSLSVGIDTPRHIPITPKMNKEIASSPERYVRSSGLGRSNSTIDERIESKKKQLTELQQEYEEIVATLEYDTNSLFPLFTFLTKILSRSEDPNKIVKRHISILKNYNEVKDVATLLIAKIAEQRHMTISEVMKEMGVDMASK